MTEGTMTRRCGERGRRLAIGGPVLGLVAMALAAGPAEADLRVVASTPDLRALAEAVGGPPVEVESLARPGQNFHDVEVRPSLMVKLRRADLLVTNGLDLDFWVDALVRGAGNPRLLPGGPGRVDASQGIPVLEVPAGPVDRSMGDVHPRGNPHYTLDPESAVAVTGTILDALARAAPGQRARFEDNRRQFLDRLAAARARWTATLGPHRGARVVVAHDTWVYFLARFGLVRAGTIEDRPGIPPSAAHLAALVRRMRADGVRVVILDPWADRRLGERVAAEAGARLVVLAHTVGARPGTGSYLDLIEHNVRVLAAALGS